jgi:TorA maturation chaperone TorD
VKGTSPDQHLVRLRALLADWKLVRRSAASEPEDHVSGLFDVMRHLVSEGYSFDEQKAFYGEFVHSELLDFCGAIERSPNA